MGHEYFIHLERGDLLAAAIDDLLEPASDPQETLLIHHPLVAGAEPAVGESLGIGLRICSHIRG
jgi:hypothetical protein